MTFLQAALPRLRPALAPVRPAAVRGTRRTERRRDRASTAYFLNTAFHLGTFLATSALALGMLWAAFGAIPGM